MVRALANLLQAKASCRSFATLRSTLELAPETPVTVSAWIKSVRRLKNVAFADVTDGSSSQSLMVVLEPSIAKQLSTGSFAEFRGTLKRHKQNDLELHADKISLIGPSPSDYPLQKKFHTNDFLRTIPQFRLRSSLLAATLRYRSFSQHQIASFFCNHEFTQVNSPILTSSDCEGAGEVFSVVPESSQSSGSDDPASAFFGAPAYLSVSSQLHLEVFAASLSRVWNMAPAFRAEKSDTYKHLSEFWMVEAELLADSLDDVLQVAEGMVKSTVPSGRAAQDLLEAHRRNSDSVRELEHRWSVLGGTWNRTTYANAIELLQKTPHSPNPAIKYGDDLSSQDEKFLAGTIFKSPVFVTHYPAEQKPFYMKLSDSPNGPVAECFDLLVPHIGELIGGSMREHDYDLLLANMSSKNVAGLEWYLDLRKYGTSPHGGFGLGFERLVSYVCNLDNIREAIGFPRWYGRIDC